MATTTPNLGLTLPTGNENVSRQIINGNMQLIDDAFGGLTPVSAALSSNMTINDRTSTIVVQMQLTKGTWLILGHVNFENKKVGMRGMDIQPNANGFWWAGASATGYGSGSEHNLGLCGFEVLTLSQTTNVNLLAYCAVGTGNTDTVIASGTDMLAIKLKD